MKRVGAIRLSLTTPQSACIKLTQPSNCQEAQVFQGKITSYACKNPIDKGGF